LTRRDVRNDLGTSLSCESDGSGEVALKMSEILLGVGGSTFEYRDA
jgi:hypothetical protein